MYIFHFHLRFQQIPSFVYEANIPADASITDDRHPSTNANINNQSGDVQQNHVEEMETSDPVQASNFSRIMNVTRRINSFNFQVQPENPLRVIPNIQQYQNAQPNVPENNDGQQDESSDSDVFSDYDMDDSQENNSISDNEREVEEVRNNYIDENEYDGEDDDADLDDDDDDDVEYVPILGYGVHPLDFAGQLRLRQVLVFDAFNRNGLFDGPTFPF